MTAKVKVSVTIDRRLLHEVERLAGDASRSEIFERALLAWVRGRARVELDRAIERYYVARSAEEQREDENWSALGDESVRTQWSK
jgi:metal-responsive CopG/Arc/MetJ family transcriptional regulator